MRFSGSVVIVTGAGQGIGAATAEAFAREGASVVVGDVDADLATKVANGIETAGGAAVPVVADVATQEGASTLVETARAGYGRLDTLVNCAGTVATRPLLETTEEDWDRVIDVNLKAVFLTCRAAVPLLREHGGSIVNISSIGAFKPVKGHTAYGAAKAGVVMLTKILALELGEVGIRANSVCPGPIDTQMFRATSSKPGFPFDASKLPLGRVGEPDELAAAVLFLASRDAAFITGAELTVDGGSAVGRR